MTDEDLGYRQGVVEKVKFGYYPLGEALINKAKSKTDKKKKKEKKTDKRDKNLVVSISIITLQSLKISMIIKKYHLILCIEGCKIFIKHLMG